MESFKVLKPGDVVKHVAYGWYTFVAKHRERYVFSGVFITKDNLAHKFILTGEAFSEVYLAAKTQEFLKDARITSLNLNDVRKEEIVLLQKGLSDLFLIAVVSDIDLSARSLRVYGSEMLDVDKKVILATGFRAR